MNASVTENYSLVLVHTESLILRGLFRFSNQVLVLICITAVSVTLESLIPLIHPVAMAVYAGKGPNLYDKFEYVDIY